jgi:hypothetical protein
MRNTRWRTTCVTNNTGFAVFAIKTKANHLFIAFGIDYAQPSALIQVTYIGHPTPHGVTKRWYIAQIVASPDITWARLLDPKTRVIREFCSS